MKTLDLSNGQETLLDPEDLKWARKFTWHMKSSDTSHGYVWRDKPTGTGKYKKSYLHREIFERLQGGPVTGDVDHLDGNGLNNVRSNLRISTRTQNNVNRPPVSGTSSKYKGVSWDSSKNRWVSSLSIDNKTKKLGRFKNEWEAALVYDIAAKRLHGEFAWLNGDHFGELSSHSLSNEVRNRILNKL